MFRSIYVLLWITFLLLPVGLLAFLPKKKLYRVYRFCYALLAKIFRFKIKVNGSFSKDDPVLFVSNHMSYTDILVLGAVLPGCFVSKAEVAKWPVIGWIAKFNGTLFIDRKKSEAGNHLSQIENALFVDNKNLIIFPEGTTGDGRGVLPFKSSLFKVAENLPASKSLTIQPVTINYTHINGLPIQTNERKKIAWIGDADFGPHFKEMVNLGYIRVEVTIHEPIKHFSNRKTLAADCQKAVESALSK